MAATFPKELWQKRNYSQGIREYGTDLWYRPRLYLVENIAKDNTTPQPEPKFFFGWLGR